jgi:predicted RNA-binding protein associated with RNAse of E/G family
MHMVRTETVRFEIRRHRGPSKFFENDLVARLPGLLITQFEVPSGEHPDLATDKLALRFDFTDEWYSVIAFLDDEKSPTGHYRIFIQSPLQDEDGMWRAFDLILGLEVTPNGMYTVTGEEEFCGAVEEGWMRVYAAANAREALRKLCIMLDQGQLPQEVMDAVGG